MKFWNRFLAALLAGMMLCAAPVVAEEEIALDDGGEVLPAQGAGADGLEIDMQALPELLPEVDGLELDESLALSGELDLAGDGSVGGEALPGEAGTEANASSDFEIENGVLVKYWGKGGDVVIPYGVEKIGEDAFWCCSRLTSVKIPNSVYSIGEYAFEGCEKLTSVKIPNSVYSIGKCAFEHCEKLTSVTIPNSVYSIGISPFGACGSLMDINVSKDNMYFASPNGVLYSYDMKTLIQCPGGKKNVTIPNSVTSIREYAFEGCEKLTSVTIPNSVTKIGEGAFLWCHKLTSAIILSKKIKLGEAVFNFCPVIMHIISGSDAIAWAENAGEQYDIIKISDDTIKLKIRQTHKLTVSGLKSSQITWSSSDKKVATVSGGKVKAVGAGKCTISAKIKDGDTLKCMVTVTDPAKLSKTSLTISAVDSAMVKLTGASGKKVTWSSSKTGVAKITKSSSGSATVAGVKPGTAVITAKIAGGKTLKCTVKVVAPLKMTTVKLANESGKRMLHAKFANQSGKKITYIKCDILQYDYRDRKLKSPYDSFDLSTTINAHASTTKSVDVNGDTDHVKYRIIEVKFSDGTTWRP